MATTATERPAARAAGLSTAKAERRLTQVGPHAAEIASGTVVPGGAVLAWRPSRESVRSVGPVANRLIIAGIAVEIAMVALLAYLPRLADIVHTGALSGRECLFVRPPVILGAEELRKSVVRRRPA
jgi:hypothetical protein